MLSVENQQLLSRIVWRRKPLLVGRIPALGEIALTDDEREDIREILADELCEAGLQPNGEPNDYGLKIDSLIGALMDY